MDFRGGARALAVCVFVAGLLASSLLAAQTTIATYTYNAKGQRITKTVGGVTTRYVYDEQGHLMSEISPSGEVWKEVQDGPEASPPYSVADIP